MTLGLPTNETVDLRLVLVRSAGLLARGRGVSANWRGAEPVAGAQHLAMQRLQFFLSESRWDVEQVNSRRLELLRADPATALHGGGCW